MDFNSTLKILNESEGFPNSKVKTIVYHGTDNEFDKFNTDKGVWFISDKNEAKEYGSRIITAYINIRNPYISSHDENTRLRIDRLMKKALPEHDSIILPKDQNFHDVNIYTEALYDVYIVFSQDQIKVI